MGNEKGLLGALRERGHKSWRKNVLISYHESFATDAAVTIAFSNTIIDTNSNSNQVKSSQAKLSQDKPSQAPTHWNCPFQDKQICPIISLLNELPYMYICDFFFSVQ